MAQLGFVGLGKMGGASRQASPGCWTYGNWLQPDEVKGPVVAGRGHAVGRVPAPGCRRC